MRSGFWKDTQHSQAEHFHSFTSSLSSLCGHGISITSLLGGSSIMILQVEVKYIVLCLTCWFILT